MGQAIHMRGLSVVGAEVVTEDVAAHAVGIELVNRAARETIKIHTLRAQH